MGAPTTNQYRIEMLEQGLGNLKSTMEEQISVAVNAATYEMQKTLIKQLTNSLEQTTQRLENRIDRSKKKQDGFMNLVKGEQEKFQDEIRSTLTSFKVAETVHSKATKGSSEQWLGKGRSGMNEGEGFESGRHKGFGDGSGRFGENGWERNGGGSGSSGVAGNWRYKRLDLPLFTGQNPDGWIMSTERFFQFYHLTEEEKLEASVVAMKGDALLWFQWEHGRRPILRWEEWKSMLLRQFRSTSSGSLQEQWLDHRQTGGVVDYRRKFIELLAP